MVEPALRLPGRTPENKIFRQKYTGSKKNSLPDRKAVLLCLDLHFLEFLVVSTEIPDEESIQ